eukprot:scaffold76746_cov67-Attheya_sp.AAC.3
MDGCERSEDVSGSNPDVGVKPPALIHPRQKHLRAHTTVMCRGVMLGKVVRKIFGSLSPIKNVELALTFTVFKPIKAHVGTTVVNLNGCGQLRASHFDENDSDHDTFFCIEETGAQFGFSGRGENNLHNGA